MKYSIDFMLNKLVEPAKAFADVEVGPRSENVEHKSKLTHKFEKQARIVRSDS